MKPSTHVVSSTRTSRPRLPTPALRSLFTQVQRMKLDVATLAPVHGQPVPWSAFANGMGAGAR